MKLDKITVAKRYGKALFELAVESQQTENVHRELMKVREIFESLDRLGDLLSDARLDLHEKRAIMDTLLQGFEGIVHDSLEIIYQYDRMYDILLIIDEFERRYNDSQGIATGFVTSAVPLKEKQREQLSQKMAVQLGYQKVHLTEIVDPEILGGVIVETNHFVVDGSIRSRLERLRKELRN
ncbi:ATP synthase F1 subunit delta [Enterococcus olivae]